MSKKVVIVGLYYHPSMPSRVKMVYDYFIEKKYDTFILCSDFVHSTKTYDDSVWKHCIKVHVPSYKSNLSFQRIISHVAYALQIKKQLSFLNPDIVYVCVPPNYSSLCAAAWARKHGSKCIIDVIDIWPNANIPSNWMLKKIYKIWGGIRDKAIKLSNYVILECSVYSKDIPQVPAVVIPLCRQTCVVPNYLLHDAVKIAYLGAFSTSYDFESLVYMAREIKRFGRKIMIVLIGCGDEKKNVVKSLQKEKIEFVDYGILYDEQKKQEIFNTCDFGYNGFRSGMIVGQSYKSLDYMCCGLALINSLKGDLEQIVSKEQCGYNFNKSSINDVAQSIANISKTQLDEMKKRSFNAYCKYFSWNAYVEKMNKMMNEVLK